MSSAAPPGTCAQHRRRPSVTSCVSCGSAMCRECLVYTPVGYKCLSCTHRVVPEPPSAVRSPRPKAHRRGIGALAGVVVLLAVGLIALVLARAGGPSTAGLRTSPPAAADASSSDVAVLFTGASGLQMGGNLVTPAAMGHPFAGVVIVPDIGPGTRDGPAIPGSLPDPLYSDLAHAFAQMGIASLRYDPRGQGQSALPAGTALKFSDLVGDAQGALAFLAGRADVAPNDLAVLGEGAGGFVALQLAAQDPAVKEVILVSTPGRPLAASLADEVRGAAPTPADGAALAAQEESVAAAVAAGEPVPNAASLPSALRSIFPSGEDALLQPLFSFDPLAVARTLHVPALVVYGGADQATTAADQQALGAALGARAQVMAAPNADHTLNLVSLSTVVNNDANHPVTSSANSMRGQVIVVRDNGTLDSIAQWAITQFTSPAP